MILEYDRTLNLVKLKIDFVRPSESVLSSRNGYVREAVVDQQFAFLGVHVD